ncbi:hypothetical protein [Burkholderia pyrrocinia]|uniref:hypothetical protein n=1 Tax=Burkholderia pyrrocinia TaxID=60550 RepID=UPI00158E7741|nr:hypothetical protein [Burkholderia pyrrocinia]
MHTGNAAFVRSGDRASARHAEAILVEGGQPSYLSGHVPFDAASTLAGVASLFRPDVPVEVDAIAPAAK